MAVHGPDCYLSEGKAKTGLVLAPKLFWSLACAYHVFDETGNGRTEVPMDLTEVNGIPERTVNGVAVLSLTLGQSPGFSFPLMESGSWHEAEQEGTMATALAELDLKSPWATVLVTTSVNVIRQDTVPINPSC